MNSSRIFNCGPCLFVVHPGETPTLMWRFLVSQKAPHRAQPEPEPWYRPLDPCQGTLASGLKWVGRGGFDN